MTDSPRAHHVLIVAYHFPPSRAVGALRPARMAEALLAKGYSISVVTAPADTGAAWTDAVGVRVFPAPLVRSPRDWILRVRDRLVASREHTFPTTAGDGRALQEAVPAARTPRWKRLVSSLLWLPDDQQGFMAGAARRAWRIHRRHPIDLLLTTAPPFSCHLAGLFIQSFTGASWVADFRDPWTANLFKGPEMRTGLSDRIEQWLERRVVNRAHLVVSATEGIQRSLSREEGGKARHIVVRNGLDTVLQRPARTPGAPFRIVHMGTFYLKRDPRPFLEAVRRVRERLSLSSTDLQIDFIGSSRTFNGAAIPSMVTTLGLEGVVTFVDSVPRVEAIRMAARADLLLLLAHGQPDQVPQKLYEYLTTRVPILALAEAGGESAEMLRRVGGHFIVPENDPEAIAQALGCAIQEPTSRPAGDATVLAEWTVERQLRPLLGAIEALL